jgi:putative NIF3 family GTP cyclohydrolase 1 type 2
MFMKLKEFYQEIIKSGIEADIREKSQIAEELNRLRTSFKKLDLKAQEVFDQETLTNPYADTRIIYGDETKQIKTVIAGIDVDGAELVTVDRLNEKGAGIDLVIAHHPAGLAYAKFYDVMDLQIDAYASSGVNLAQAQAQLISRKQEVERRVHAANHQRAADIAKLLDLNFLCMHTPCDNLAYQFISVLLKKAAPVTLGQIMDILMSVPEYKFAAKANNAPLLAAGSNSSRCKNIEVEFTGGTEGPHQLYKNLAAAGVDTIVAMHQSEEHFKVCKELGLNVIFASHIASDNIGVNIMLDHLESKGRLKILEFSGFRRVSRGK